MPFKKQTPADDDTQKNITIPVIQENISVDKKIAETGKVVISKHVTEDVETVNIPLLHHEHFVEHVPVNTLIDDIPPVRYEGDTIIIPVVREVLVKRNLLVEEVRITKRTIETNEQHQFTLRKEHVSVERKQ